MRGIAFQLGAVLLFGLVLSATAFGQDVQHPPVRLYPDSATGLNQLIDDMLAAKQEGRKSEFTEHAVSLRLPNHEAWLRSVFGQKIGLEISPVLGDLRARLPQVLSDFFDTLIKERFADARVHRFDQACDPVADARQYPFLARMVQPVPLYDVRVFNGSGTKFRGIWFFAYVDGAFRYIGSVKFQVPKPPGAIEVPPAEQQKKLKEQARPRYPTTARQQWVQGTVLIGVVIDREGHIAELHLLQGHCWLAEAAQEAVRQWRYEPTLLNGEPVQVITTIEVVFTISR